MSSSVSQLNPPSPLSLLLLPSFNPSLLPLYPSLLQEVKSEVVELVEELPEDADITTQEEHTVRSHTHHYTIHCSIILVT